VQGISAEQLADILEMLDPEIIRNARDAAVLALGWAACRRRSEIVGLDWMERGDTPGSTGVLTVDEKGCHLRLMVSKTRQEGEPEYYVVPRESVPVSVAAIEAWVRVADLKPGSPVFLSLRATSKSGKSDVEGVTWDKRDKKWRARLPRGADGKSKSLGAYGTKDEAVAALESELGRKVRRRSADTVITQRRMTGQIVAQITKIRLRQWYKLKHPRWSREKIEAEVAQRSGHSLRVGHITDASERGVPAYKIQNQSGHKDGKMIGVYSRSSEKFRDNSLKGVRGGL